jgi:hypothetical protein
VTSLFIGAGTLMTIVVLLSALNPAARSMEILDHEAVEPLSG